MSLRSGLAAMIFAFIAAGLNGNAQAEPFRSQPRDYAYFLERLVDLDRLPFLEGGVVNRQFSSYDRRSRYDAATGRYIDWDANRDAANYVRVEGQEIVLAEMTGPGCITRIWSANPFGEIRFYLDGDTSPTLAFNFIEMFSGRIEPFVPPLVWRRAGVEGAPRASLSYVPIPYEKSCKVTVCPKVEIYYHIGYETYAPGSRVETFRLPLNRRERSALERVCEVLRNGFDPSTMAPESSPSKAHKGIGRRDEIPADPQQTLWRRLTEHDRSVEVRLRPGEERTLATLDGPAILTELRASLQSDDPEKHRSVMLRVYWDEEATPAIEAPLVEFFGASFGPTIYHSLPMGKTSKAFYSYWRMPFRRQARLVVANESRHPAQVRVRLRWRKQALPYNAEYFHAKWRRDETSREFDYPILECRGRGRLVGVAQFVHNIAGGWWGEGDEKVYVDGEKFPSIFGTGSEDYYGDAWGIRWFATPFAGCPYSNTFEMERGQKQSCYRWHIADPVPFDWSLRMTIENYSAESGTGGQSVESGTGWQPVEAERNDYSSIAYWYQMPGGTDFFRPYARWERLERVPPPARPSVEAESVFKSTPLPPGVSIIDENECDRRLSGGKALRLRGADGAVFPLPLPVAIGDVYSISTRNASPENVKIILLKAGEPILTTTGLRAGVNPLAIRLQSKRKSAREVEAVLDRIDLKPAPEYIARWLITGPFDNARGDGLDRSDPPQAMDFRATYRDVRGRLTGWAPATALPSNGLVLLSAALQPSTNTVSYAACAIESPDDRTAHVFFGSDEQARVWVNGQEVFITRATRAYRPDEDHCTIELRKGPNVVLVKVANSAGPTGFGMRVADPERALTFGLPK
jgi:hypothetical protein